MQLKNYLLLLLFVIAPINSGAQTVFDSPPDEAPAVEAPINDPAKHKLSKANKNNKKQDEPIAMKRSKKSPLEEIREQNANNFESCKNLHEEGPELDRCIEDYFMRTAGTHNFAQSTIDEIPYEEIIPPEAKRKISNNCDAYISSISTCDSQEICNAYYETCKSVCGSVGKAGLCHLPTVSSKKDTQLSTASVKEETKPSSTSNMGSFEGSNLSQTNSPKAESQTYGDRSASNLGSKYYTNSTGISPSKSYQGSTKTRGNPIPTANPNLTDNFKVNLPQAKIEVLSIPKQPISPSISSSNNKIITKDVPVSTPISFQNAPSNFSINVNNNFGFAQGSNPPSPSVFGDETPLQLKARENVQRKKAEELRVAEIKYQQQLQFARNNSYSPSNKSEWITKPERQVQSIPINWTDKLRAWIFGKRAQRSIAAYDSPGTTGITSAEGPSNFQKVASRYRKIFGAP